jgi:cytochrome c oxidase assembly protein subunit 11
MPPADPRTRRHSLVAALCIVFVAAMVGMSFAAVPLYRMFCQVTGYFGTTQRASKAPDAAIGRQVTIRFDSNIANGLGWSFRPEQRSITLKVGEVGKVAFFAQNRGATTTSGTASFNVAPAEAGAYFNKIACFCFTEQTLAAGEKVDMPVVFFVDPAIADNPELDGVDTITLSYTFFPAAAPARPVAAATGSDKRGSL